MQNSQAILGYIVWNVPTSAHLVVSYRWQFFLFLYRKDRGMGANWDLTSSYHGDVFSHLPYNDNPNPKGHFHVMGPNCPDHAVVLSHLVILGS